MAVNKEGKGVTTATQSRAANVVHAAAMAIAALSCAALTRGDSFSA
jgi:hypothetical protein